MTVEKLKILRPADVLIIKEIEVKLQRNLIFCKALFIYRGKCLQFLWELGTYTKNSLFKREI